MNSFRNEAYRMDRMQGQRRRRLAEALLLSLAALSTIGCGTKRGYPTAKAVTALGRPGECAFCHRRKIERVEKANLVTFDAVEYLVCDEKCRKACVYCLTDSGTTTLNWHARRCFFAAKLSDEAANYR